MPPRTPNTPPDGGDELIEQGQDVTAETQEQLKARIAALEAELAKSTAGRLIAEEESARLSAQAQSSMFTANVTERFSRRADDGQDIWWYRIDLAPCGGIDFRLNGQQFVHGTTYEFTTDVLRSVKEIVARTWDHENNINGTNENAYKVAQDRVLRGGDRRR
jgi:carboxylesterase type B